MTSTRTLLVGRVFVALLVALAQFASTMAGWGPLTVSRAQVVPPNAIERTGALTLSPAAPRTGQSVVARFAVRNVSNQSVILKQLNAAVRGPDCNFGDWNCRQIADFPSAQNVRLGPGESYRYSQERVFSQAGSYFANPSYQDDNGWHIVEFVPGRAEVAFDVGGILVSEPFNLSSTQPRTGQSVAAQFELRNTSSQPVTLKRVVAGVRGPGCPIINWECTPYADFPIVENVTLGPGQAFRYQQQRVFSMPGDYFAGPSYEDDDGWHPGHFIQGGTEVQFTVGGIVVARPLAISPKSPVSGQPVTAQFTLTNQSKQVITLKTVVAGVRGPGCGIERWDCLAKADFPVVQELRLGPNETFMYFQQRTFAQPGQYFAGPAYEDDNGWHPGSYISGGSEVDFTVSSASIPPDRKYGVNIALFSTDDAKNIAQLDRALQLGARVVRIGLSDRLLEQHAQGEYRTHGFWYLRVISQVLAEARARGLEVIILFGETPCWQSSNAAVRTSCQGGDYWFDEYSSLFWLPPRNISAFADAFTFLVGTFGKDVLAWEVWNEPNARYFWGGCESRIMPPVNRAQVQSDPNAVSYAQILLAAYQAAKTVDGSAIILGGSLAGAEGHAGEDPACGSGVPAVAFLDQMNAELLRGSQSVAYDALALHPYSDNNPPDYPVACSPTVFWTYRCRIEEVHAALARKGIARDIWITEVGWATEGNGSVTPEQQADYLELAFALLGRWNYVLVALWYNLVDSNYETSEAAGKSFGLYRYESGALVPKQSANRFRSLMTMLTGHLFVPMTWSVH